MSLEKKDYRKRLIDDKIDRYLKIFGAISIQGPKWCGKTWTSLKHANSVSYMTEKSPRDLAKVDPNNPYIFLNLFLLMLQIVIQMFRGHLITYQQLNPS